MRDLIDLLATWLGPGLRRSADRTRARLRTWLHLPPLEPGGPVIQPAPAYARRPLPAHVLARLRPLNGHEVALVRPYYTRHENRRTAAEHRRSLQFQRRTAAALASYGIDYDADRIHALTASPLPASLGDRMSKELVHG